MCVSPLADEMTMWEVVCWRRWEPVGRRERLQAALSDATPKPTKPITTSASTSSPCSSPSTSTSAKPSSSIGHHSPSMHLHHVSTALPPRPNFLRDTLAAAFNLFFHRVCLFPPASYAAVAQLYSVFLHSSSFSALTAAQHRQLRPRNLQLDSQSLVDGHLLMPTAHETSRASISGHQPLQH